MGIVIKGENVRKVYRIYRNQKERYLDFFLPKAFGKRFYALDEVSFQVEQGESVGLIGLNGSGKSTLANLIAGYSSVTSGTLDVVSNNVSMISVSAGVDTKLTGLENIKQKCLLLGLDSKTIKEITPEIIEFAGLGDFIYQPVKTYSSGMRSKLGFAIAVNVDPDILIIDEALSVGDQTFTSKCIKKMNVFREKGKTIVFVSHSMPQVEEFCSKAIWLHGGKIQYDGEVKETIREYNKFIARFNSYSEARKKLEYEKIYQRQMKES